MTPAAAPAIGSATAPGLSKAIRFHQLFAIGFGTMIGVGWMLVAGGWVIAAGPGGALVAFGIGAVAFVGIGLVYAEMGCCLPYSGGEIVFVYEGLGVEAAFFMGWMSTLTYVTVTAFEAVAAAWIVAVLLPFTSGPTLYRVLGSDVTLGSLVIGFGGLAALGWVNARGGLASARLQTAATTLKVAATSVFVVAALAHGSEANRQPWFVHDAGGGAWLPVISVLATVPVWYGGFNVVAQALGEVGDIRRIGSLPLVMTAVMLAGFTFFACVILATASSVPRAVLQGSEFPVADALFGAFASPWPGRVVLVAGLLGILTSWNAVIFSGARVLFCLGRARIVPTWFSRVHPRHGSPVAAVAFIVAAAAPIALLGRNSLLPILSLVGVSYAIGYFLVSLSLLRLRRSAPGMARPYRVPGHPFTTVGACVLTFSILSVLVFNIWHGSDAAIPVEFVAFAVWIALGLSVWRAAGGVRASVGAAERERLIRER